MLAVSLFQSSFHSTCSLIFVSKFEICKCLKSANVELPVLFAEPVRSKIFVFCVGHQMESECFVDQSEEKAESDAGKPEERSDAGSESGQSEVSEHVNT